MPFEIEVLSRDLVANVFETAAMAMANRSGGIPPLQCAKAVP